MSESDENRFDSILLALAEQHKEGVPEVNSKCSSLIISVQKAGRQTNKICLSFQLIFKCILFMFASCSERWLDF